MIMSLVHETLGGKGIDADEILPGLYQGSEPTIGTVVRDAGFNVLVLCAMEIQGASRYLGVTVLKCPLDDDEDRHPITDEEWNRAFWTAARVASYVRQGYLVLVTCYLGLNRSGLVSAITCHFLKGWPGWACVEHVQSCRPDALFNESFVNALVTRLK